MPVPVHVDKAAGNEPVFILQLEPVTDTVTGVEQPAQDSGMHAAISFRRPIITIRQGKALVKLSYHPMMITGDNASGKQQRIVPYPVWFLGLVPQFSCQDGCHTGVMDLP